MKIQPPTTDQIRAQAYLIYLQRGRCPGQAIDDWLQAEYELLQMPTDQLANFGAAEVRAPRSDKTALVGLVHTAKTPKRRATGVRKTLEG